MSSIQRRLAGWLVAVVAGHAGAAAAWGPDGHHTVGAIADRLIAGTPAATRVGALIGPFTLRDAAVWADCAKGVEPSKNYQYTGAGEYPECAIFETPALEAEMIDFVRRNDRNCVLAAGEKSCHRQYHYADVPIQRDAYALGAAGTRVDDIVHAVAAAIHVLRGEPSPAPFDIEGPREALLLLAHYVGDIHQPLHVGAIYLDAAGHPVDPDPGAIDPGTGTQGGNLIQRIDPFTAGVLRCTQLHATWDGLPSRLTDAHVSVSWLRAARAVPRTRGDVAGWPDAWATGTLGEARHAFARVALGPKQGKDWTAELPAGYDASSASIKRRQLTLAGARLAQVLQALWP